MSAEALNTGEPSDDEVSAGGGTDALDGGAGGAGVAALDGGAGGARDTFEGGVGGARLEKLLFAIAGGTGGGATDEGGGATDEGGGATDEGGGGKRRCLRGRGGRRCGK